MSRLIVFDALGLAYRAHFAFIGRPLMNSKGENTSAIFGFANIALKFRREHAPEFWALAWDGPGPTFRHELYGDYKATRPPMPEDLAAQLGAIEDLSRHLGLPVIEKAGMEADDVMATLAQLAAAAGHEVILVTGDKDMLQVVTDRVTVLAPQGKGEDYARMDPAAVRAKWGVGPEHIRDVLALMGDSSDNIPGVKGVGEKTAVELLTQFHSLDELYARLGEVRKPALKKKLEDSREAAFLSRELATLRSDLELGVGIEDLKVAPIRGDDLAAFAGRWEIRRLEQIAAQQGVDAASAGAPVTGRDPARRGSAAEQEGTGVKLAPKRPAAAEPPRGTTAAVLLEPDLFGTPTIAPPAAPLPRALREPAQASLDLWHATPLEVGDSRAPSLEALEQQLHAVRARAVHGLALLPLSESSSGRGGTLVGLALAARDGTSCYLPLAHVGGANFDPKRVVEWLAPALADPTVEKVGHDLKRERHLLERFGLVATGRGMDLHIASFLCDPSRDHSLAALARDVLAVELTPLEPPMVRGRGRAPLASASVEDMAQAACRAAAALFPLAEALRAQLDARDQWGLCRDLEHPLIDVLVAMEREGIALDVPVLEVMSASSAAELAALEQRLHQLAGEAVNLNSGPQLAHLLFEVLKLPPGRRTKTGFSTDSEVLEGLAAEHEFPRRLLEWRALAKLKSTYLDALPAAVDPRDGRVHTSFEQTGAATGRLSSYDPNLQNIPMRTPQGRAIRRAFVAAPGCVLIGADYSQIELRVMAHLSGDPQLIEAFESGEDIHASTARRIFKVEGAVDPSLRARAKIVNFGVMYGMGARSLAQQMGIPLEEAKEFIDGYFRVYAGVRTYLNRVVADARESGYVQTLLGRRRYLPSLRSSNGLDRSNAERAAINAPIQGSAADLVKLAMIRVHDTLARRGKGEKLLLQVHDELVFECPAAAAATTAELVRRAMEGCFPLRVPLTVTVGTGATWFDIH
ncbi:MAG: DNA polymerase I [Candidatus Eisenbacteria bacterium]|uniref:DNA polymerase I n=1 Tax=Eiseniibacteriota bacterium TaxID=2212470 RepID=A0A849SJL0_UNCEI|nr:DNA polymerase I [Candidatus Eisenbacteria bacterium]